MEFIGRVNQAAVSCADRYLTIWDLETLKLLRHVRMRDAQVGLRFCPSMGVLTSWGVDEFNHEIIVWNVDKLTVMHVLDGHSGAVKDICEVAPPPSTGTSDPTEKIWEPILGEGPGVPSTDSIFSDMYGVFKRVYGHFQSIANIHLPSRL